MSRRGREENTQRMRRGVPPDVSHGSLSSAPARTATVNFLNPDVPHGTTSLERAPSLNRLHAQSSTETSGLGETITSGFSSQESVQSYLGDERERTAPGSTFWDRSYRRDVGSPGDGRAVVDHEQLEKYGNQRVHHSRPSKHQELQEQHLTVPGLSPGHYDGQARHQADAGRDRERHRGSDQPSRPVRDTGGRSLTPQQAKAEYEDRQRRLKANQRQDSPAYTSSTNLYSEKPLLGNSSENLDKQRRPNSVHRQTLPEYTELPGIPEHHPGGRSENRGRPGGSSNIREVVAPDPKTLDHRRNSIGDKNNLQVGKVKPNSKDSTGNPSSHRATGRAGSKETPANIKTTPGTREGAGGRSEGASDERRSSEVSRDRERKNSSRDKPHSGTSRNNSDEFYESGSSFKSFETVRQKSRSQESTINSDDEIFVDSSAQHSHKTSAPRVLDVSAHTSSGNSRRNKGDNKDSSKFPYDQSQSSGVQKGPYKKRIIEEEAEAGNRIPRNNWKGSTEKDYLQTEDRNPYVKQRSDPTENQRASKQSSKEGQRRSSDTSKGDEDARRKSHQNARTHRQDDGNHRDEESVSENRRDSGKRYAKPGEVRSVETADRSDNARPARTSSGKDVRSREARPDDARIKDSRSREARPDDARIKDSRSREARPDDARIKDSRSREAIYWGQSKDHPREHSDGTDRYSSGSSSFSSKQVRRDEPREAGRVDARQSRRFHPDISEDDTAPGSSKTSKGRGQKNMNYERLYHEASRSTEGTGGGSESWRNREYPAALDGGYSSSPTRKVAGGGMYASNMTRNGHVRGLNPSPLSESNIANEQSNPIQQPRSAPYTKFQVSSTQPGPVPVVQLTCPDSPGLDMEHMERELERRDSRSSNRSHISRNSLTGSNLFLGVNTGSAWTKWSRERRASYRRRLEKLEQEEPKEARISTPVKKARQEGLKFVHPDLEGRYLSEDDLNELRRHKQQQVHAMRVIERSRRNKFRMKSEVKLTPEQWHMLEEFWNHSVFVGARYFGILISLVALIFMTVSITNRSWVTHSSWNLTIVEGLWINCSKPVTAAPNAVQECHSSNGGRFQGGLWETCYQNHSDSRAVVTCPDRKPHWQNAVIGLMIFATAFGFLASVLSICGVFTNSLPRKIYYFHSAGEIFFICALSATVALIIFPNFCGVGELYTRPSLRDWLRSRMGGNIFLLSCCCVHEFGRFS